MTQPESKDSTLVQRFGWGVIAEVAKIATAFGTFILLTRLLSVTEYGVLVGTTALLAFIVPQTSFGASYLVLKRIAEVDATKRAATTSPQYQLCIGLSLAGGGAALAIIVAFQPLILPQTGRTPLLLFAASELVFSSMVEVAGFTAQATKNLRSLAAIRSIFGSSRLVAAAALLLAGSQSLTIWACALAVTGLFSVLISQLLLFGGLRRPVVPSLLDLREGLPFSLGFGADKVRESADQFMLLRSGRLNDAGLYGAAFRIIQALTAPIVGLLNASNARFFESHGADVTTHASELTVRLTRLGLLISAPIAIVTYFGIGGVVSLLFPEFADLHSVIRWLSFIPILMALEVFAASALTGLGKHRTRVQLMVATSLTNIALNLALIPEFGWRGAAAATAISNTIYAVLVWIALLRCRRQAQIEE